MDDLLEREAELGVLRDAADRAAGGRGTVVLLSGEAGIGKTRLIGDYVGGLVLRSAVGTCDDLISPLTLGPFRDIARSASSDLEGLDARSDRETIIESLLRAMSDPADPLVLVVDDAQWADDASLDIVRTIATRISRLAGVLIVSYRAAPADENPSLTRLLGGLTGPDCVRLPLRPLSHEVVRRLAVDAGIDPNELVAAAGGNPFYLSEVLASANDFAPSSQEAVPHSVRDAVLGRHRRLGDRAQRCLELLAVMPVDVGTSSLSMAGVAPDDLDEAERSGMIAVVGGRVSFRHELARRAIVETLSGSQQQHLHQRVLALLDATGADSARLVHHAVNAGATEVVVRQAPLAAVEAAKAGSHREAIRMAELALERSADLVASTARTLHELAAHSCYVSNRFADGVQHADAAVERAEDDRQRARALTLTARMRLMTAQPERAIAEARRAVELLEPFGATDDLALAHSVVGRHDATRGHFESGRAACERALSIALERRRDDIRALALNYLGICRIGAGDDAGLDDLEGGLQLARAIDHGEYQFRIANNLGVSLMGLGRLREAAPHIEFAERISREHGIDHGAFHAGTHANTLRFYFGDWHRAELGFRELLAKNDEGVTLAALLAYLGRILVRRGDEDGRELIDRAWAIAERTDEINRIAAAGAAQLDVAWLDGDDARVRTLARDLAERADRSGNRYLLGEAARAMARVEGPSVPARSIPEPFAVGIGGDHLAAARLWHDRGQPYERALELVETDDERLHSEALLVLEELGASATARRCRHMLRERGVSGVPRGPRPTTRSNPLGLTRRQEEVVGLLAGNLTNAEIAERLVISVRTVDNHVAAILTKLGVESRRDAVAVHRRAIQKV